uniref:sensor histidine kinase KdpD n=1 Tax=Carnobacterium TaxID=2747 RepID=UPI00344EDA8B
MNDLDGEKTEYEKKIKGNLRIYFGYAAGVGKTYAMLKDAHEIIKEGVDVVAGYIEPHDRPGTSRLLNGNLTVLPMKEIPYKGIILKEFDLDAALKRKPTLILVDELAHSNAPLSRNKKRFQDIEELLKAGIDVYTTVNVQHIESLNNIVEKITGVYVQERIPDSVFDHADQIELIDIEPVDLIDRLNKGKIYKLSQVKRALDNFFTKGKLFALREIALRKTADQVNRMALQSKITNRNSFTKEHVLVCVSSSPTSLKVIRSAARIADAFKASFTALYVEHSEDIVLSDKEKESLHDNLRLAEQLGAQISTLFGDDVSNQIAEYAKISHVSKIVIGKTVNSKRWVKTNFVDTLAQLAPDIDIYIIPDSNSAIKRETKFKFMKPPKFSVEDTIKTLLILASSTLIGFLFEWMQFDFTNIIIIYILGVQINAVVTKGKLYSVVSSVLSVLAFNYFFTSPRFTFEVFNSSYPITFLVMLAAGLITSSLTKRIKEQARQTAEKAYRTKILLETNQKLQMADNVYEILNQTGNQLVRLLDKDVIIYPVFLNALSDPILMATNQSQETLITYNALREKGVAEWVLKNNKRAGATTNTLPASKYLYMSVRKKNQVFAVVGISMEAEKTLEIFEKSILIAILGECSIVMEKEALRERQHEISTKIEKEQLRTNLLRAVSHDLRTPLTGISGNAKLLMENSNDLTEYQKKESYTTIYDDSMWLINLVENLLSITKIENENMKLNPQIDVLNEVIAEAVKHVDRHISEHDFQVDLGEEILVAKIDPQLIMQVIVNIINNAIKYTEKNSEIYLIAKKEGRYIQVEIADNGPGISDEVKEKIFELFYTANEVGADARRGLGLGLSLCRSILTAHGGEIYVKDNKPKGTIIGFKLESVEVNLNE